MAKTKKINVRLAPEVKKICSDIKNLNIQGARNVAIMGLSALVIQGLSYRGRDKNKLVTLIINTSDYLKSLRPTEPMLFNFLDTVIKRVKKGGSVIEVKEILYTTNQQIESMMRTNKVKIAKYATKLIRNNDVILTHCHSSTVVESLIHAKAKGKKFKVFATETRPRWQGHKTVKELAGAGIDVTLIPDGAVGTVIKDYHVKKIMIGADAIDGRGNFANKIGSFTIALIAKKYNVPLYVLAELYKYDKRPKIVIEHRDPSEVIDPKLFKDVKILNLAFEIVSRELVKAYITEKGAIRPARFPIIAKKELRNLLVE